MPILPASSSRRVAWKNGRGSTLEIASDAESAGGEWTWRLSIAEVPERAAFSHFPGVDRLIGRLHGEGLTIERVGTPQVVPGAGAALAFAGEEDVVGVPTGAGVRDVNLMVQRDRWRGTMEVLREGSRVADGPVVLVHAAHGSAAINARQEPTLKVIHVGQTLVSHGFVEVAGAEGAVIVVCELTFP
ncbi:MAG: HutD family protein [Planctomycetes bacterium]|nr:HutD family protein [Planctomycetota bacterium]